MTEAWYIDTLDARGGYAFASYRANEPPGTDSYEDPISTVFISPPSFSAEPIVSRATALAAGRGSFQEGLFVERQEVPFVNLSDVTAFVSRLYGTSGGGDSPGGGEGPPPRPEGGEPPPEGTPEPPGIERPSGMEWTNATDLIREGTKKFFEARPEQVGEPGEQFTWFEKTIDRPDTVFEPMPLEAAAVRLEWEIWSRLPTGDEDDALLNWLDAAHSLVCLVTVIGLDRERLRRASVSSRNELWFRDFSSNRRPTSDFLRFVSGREDVSLFDWYPWDEYPFGPYFDLREFSCNCGDIIELLCKVPVTSASCRALGQARCPDEELSLFALLTMGIAAPEWLGGGAGQQKTEEFLFAACAVASAANLPRIGAKLWLTRPRDLSSKLWLASLSKMQQETLVWLKGSFPSRALPMPLESMISSAPELAYE